MTNAHSILFGQYLFLYVWLFSYVISARLENPIQTHFVNVLRPSYNAKHSYNARRFPL